MNKSRLGALALTVITPLGLVPMHTSPAEAAPSSVASPAARITSFDYTAGSVWVPQIKHSAPLSGHVVAPVGARTTRPVVVFVHGWHDWCSTRSKENESAWPYPKGTFEVPNLNGYEYAQQALAKQGYVTVAVNMNTVNALDSMTPDYGAAARSVLVRANLKALAQRRVGRGTAKTWPHAVARPNMARTMLVGHSRGGEGINRTALDSTARDPWRIIGMVNTAPTNFGRIGTPTIPSTTLLPSCDGDVTDLAGQAFTDRAAHHGKSSALHSSVRLSGAVHNFFNTQWTPGLAKGPSFDDGDLAGCASSRRISPMMQRSEFVT